MTPAAVRADAEAVYAAAVAAVRPAPLVRAAVARFPADWAAKLAAAPRVHAVGAGKAGAGMAAGLEAALAPHLAKLGGLVNVPDGGTADLQRVRLHPARPAGSNLPTAAGVTGADAMLARLASAGPADVAVALISGGGSALLPAPVAGVPLAEKLRLTSQLQAAGAAIDEVNLVRRHLSRVKGGRLAAAFPGTLLVGLILSDVIGDPPAVIASGPTVPTADDTPAAMGVLARYAVGADCPAAVAHLRSGRPGGPPATRAEVHNVVIGNNQTAVSAAAGEAARRGYAVVNLGSFVAGETADVARVVAGVVRSVRADGVPARPPACVLLGGETTVTLGPNPGKGGRNTEFVLALLLALGAAGPPGVCVLSGGTDGEDGPTDAAGAVADRETLAAGRRLGLDPADCLRRHDSHPFFAATGGLLAPGLTGTNVADVRVVLVV